MLNRDFPGGGGETNCPKVVIYECEATLLLHLSIQNLEHICLLLLCKWVTEDVEEGGWIDTLT